MSNKNNSKSTEAFVCEYCKKKFSSKSNRDKHRKVHLQKTLFKCNFCHYAANFKHHLENHIRTNHTKERPFNCQHPNCNRTFTLECSLIVHQLTHKKGDESIKKFKCSKCPFKTAYSSSLRDHLKTHTGTQKRFPCDLCRCKAKTKDNLKIHHDKVHLKLKPFKCHQPNCNFATRYKQSFKEHQRVHSSKDDESLLKFKCQHPECEYKTAVKLYLHRHLKTHVEVKPFCCDLCPYETAVKGHFKAHRDGVHSTVKPFKCPHPKCGLSFSLKRYLNEHQPVHQKDAENSLKFKCPSCDYKTVWKKNLNDHLKTHSEAKPFSCEYCDYKTKSKFQLKNHEITHGEEKPFKCNLCPYTGNFKKNLEAHVRVHTGETPFSCKICNNYRAKSSSVFSNHLKTCQGEKGS